MSISHEKFDHPELGECFAVSMDQNTLHELTLTKAVAIAAENGFPIVGVMQGEFIIDDILGPPGERFGGDQAFKHGGH